MWRLIEYEVHDGRSNMALDEAMLEAHLRGEVPPTLRLYGWAPPAVSIGYAQKLPDEAKARIQEAGFDIVRRATGGRAVLHLNELTYSFVCSVKDDGSASEDAILSASVLSAYKQICKGLVIGLSKAGVEVELGQGQAASRQMHDCFLATTTADLHFKGKKLVGSAQVRRRGAVLQHGSILLSQPQNLMPRLLSGKDSEPGEAQRHANLYEILDRKPTVEELSAFLKAGFEEAFARRLVAATFTGTELSFAQELKEREMTKGPTAGRAL